MRDGIFVFLDDCSGGTKYSASNDGDGTVLTKSGNVAAGVLDDFDADAAGSLYRFGILIIVLAGWKL